MTGFLGWGMLEDATDARTGDQRADSLAESRNFVHDAPPRCCHRYYRLRSFPTGPLSTGSRDAQHQARAAVAGGMQACLARVKVNRKRVLASRLLPQDRQGTRGYVALIGLRGMPWTSRIGCEALGWSAIGRRFGRTKSASTSCLS
jgi:hypothetical protein